MGAMATNDLVEHSFGLLSHQIENFNRIGFGNTVGTAQAKMNKDFDRKELGKGHADGDFHKLSDEMKYSLVLVALKLAPQTRVEEAEALKKQSKYKLEEQNIY